MATEISFVQTVLYIGLFSLLACGVTSDDCYRTCEYPPKPRLCEYELTFLWYYSMPAYCWNCPMNYEDCSIEGCTPLDGTSRPIITTNGRYPGSNIQVCQGDTIRVTVNNTMEDELSASIHWHGQYQYGTNWMDGVGMVTQCPIKNGPLFVYEFVANPAGTQLWYDMSGLSKSDGLFGSLIVRKPIEEEEEIISKAYDYDLAEHVIVMSDWSTIDGLETFTTAYAPAKVVRDHTINILINGKAQGAEFTDAFGQTVYTPRELFGVVKGNRYRMRIVSAATTSCNIAVYVESHSLKVIAADGSLVDPVDVDYLIISPGESYDFVIDANQEESSYCMHFVGTSSSACQISSSAILHYNDYDNLACRNSLLFEDVVSSHHSNYYTAPSQEIQTVTLNMLHSLDAVDSSLVVVDDLRYISLGTYYDDRFKSLDTYGGVQVIDNVAYKVSHAPLLSHEADGIEICEANGDYKIYESCEDKICSCTNVMKLELGKVIEFVLMNVKGSAYSHPMHLHGHSFHVMGQGTFDDLSVTEDEVKALDTSGLLQRLSVDQVVIKNTVDVPVNGYAIIRWKADNPGFWYFHSEVVNHQTAGMGMVIQVGDDDEITKPPTDFPKCGPWSP